MRLSQIVRFASAATLTSALLATAAVAQATSLPPAATLTTAYAEKTGAVAMSKAPVMTTTGTFEMPAAGVKADFTLVQTSPNAMRMQINIPGLGLMQSGFDGTHAWTMDPVQGPRLLTGKELDQLRDEADRRASSRHPDLFSAMETVADTSIAGERCYLVKLTWKSGRETKDCYSATTGLLVATLSIQDTQMGTIPVLSRYSEYRKFGDATIPTVLTQEMMGQQQVLTIAEVKFEGNPAGVAMPDEVKALAKP